MGYFRCLKKGVLGPSLSLRVYLFIITPPIHVGFSINSFIFYSISLLKTVSFSFPPNHRFIKLPRNPKRPLRKYVIHTRLMTRPETRMSHSTLPLLSTGVPDQTDDSVF